MVLEASLKENLVERLVQRGRPKMMSKLQVMEVTCCQFLKNRIKLKAFIFLDAKQSISNAVSVIAFHDISMEIFYCSVHPECPLVSPATSLKLRPRTGKYLFELNKKNFSVRSRHAQTMLVYGHANPMQLEHRRMQFVCKDGIFNHQKCDKITVV